MWSLIARSAWAEPATVVASTTVDGAALASVSSVGVGSASHLVVGMTVESAALASVLSVGVGSASHCDGGDDSSDP